MKITKFFIILFLTLFAPVFSFAQDYLVTTRRVAWSVHDLVGNILVPIVFITALLLFFWGVVKYIKSEGDGKAEGKKIMIWGIVALFVMTAVWGLVAFIGEEIGIDYIKNQPIPGVTR
jgi:hypothetical protein